MRSLFCTADQIGTPTGGGAVTREELRALRELGDVDALGREDINPLKHKIPDSPYAFDYVADAVIVGKNTKYDLAHFYAGMFSKTVRRLKDVGTKVTYTAAAHDIRLSQEEFKTLGIPYDLPHITEPVLWATYIEGYKSADVVICPSKASANVMTGFGCHNVRVVSHGVDPADELPLPEMFSIGYLGQVGPDKGLIYLIRAWGKLNYPDAFMRLAGANVDAMRPVIRMEGGGLVDIKGYVQNINQLFGDVCVYVQPSVSEGFGIEVLEAMMRGRPVIVSDGAGAADVVSDGTDGFVVPKRDVDAIADRITYLKEDRARLLRMGKAARQKAEGFLWDKIRPRYHEIWKTLQ